jgi:ABC-type branched-subunit amino acid transport system substrate-binding protein
LKKIVFVVIATLLVLGLILPGCGGPTPGTHVITIAIAGPKGFIQGDHGWWAAQIAAADINDLGGINVSGTMYKILLDRVDTKDLNLDGAYSADQITHAITVDGAQFVIGGFRTEVTADEIDAACDQQTIMFIDGAATSSLLYGVNASYGTYKYVFRGTPPNEVFLLNGVLMMMGMVGYTIESIIGPSGYNFSEQQVRVALVYEALNWTTQIVAGIEALCTGLGLNLTVEKGVGQTDDAAALASPLTDILNADVHMIVPILSGPVGKAFGYEKGKLGIPAVVVGINVEAQDPNYPDNTEYSPGQYGSDYEITMGTWAPNINQTSKTGSFLAEFSHTSGKFPIYTAASYDMIYAIKEAVEATDAIPNGPGGGANTTALINYFETHPRLSTTGTTGYWDITPYAGTPPMNNHDLIYGPNWVVGIGVQWYQDETHHNDYACVWPKAAFGAISNAIDMFGPGGYNIPGWWTVTGNWTGFEYPGTSMMSIPAAWVGNWSLY